MSNPTSERTPAAQTLYEERNLRLTSEVLEISNYGFYVGMGKKVLPLSSIKSAQTAAELNLQWFGVKTWGWTLNGIYWTPGAMREIAPTHESHVVLTCVQDNGKEYKIGLTAPGGDRFCRVLNQYIPASSAN